MHWREITLIFITLLVGFIDFKVVSERPVPEVEALESIGLEGPRSLQPVFDLGSRASKWLKRINANRPGNQKLQFTTDLGIKTYPVDHPLKYGPSTIFKEHDLIVRELPLNLRLALLVGRDSGAPSNLEEFLFWGARITRNYSNATRWLYKKKNLEGFRQAKSRDVRGYYHLTREENIGEKLRSWFDLSLAERRRLTPLLINLCENSQRNCENSLARAELTGDLSSYYAHYVWPAEKIYKEYFHIYNHRRDIKWAADNFNLMSVPFVPSLDKDFKAWMQRVVESAWNFGTWQLKLDFQEEALAKVTFEKNTLPHADEVGGNHIVMDEALGADEILSTRMLQHEFGHILGFPDCYVEFFDAHENVMINYQIDTENIMCSLRGRVLEAHLDELKKVYLN